MVQLFDPGREEKEEGEEEVGGRLTTSGFFIAKFIKVGSVGGGEGGKE